MPVETMIPVKPFSRGESGETRKLKTEDDPTRSDLPDFMLLLSLAQDLQQTLIPSGESVETETPAVEGGDRKSSPEPWPPAAISKPQAPTDQTGTDFAEPDERFFAGDRISLEKQQALPPKTLSEEDLEGLHPGMGTLSSGSPVPSESGGGETGGFERNPSPGSGGNQLPLESSSPISLSGTLEGGSETETTAAERPSVRIDPQNILDQLGGKILPALRNGSNGEQVVKIQLQPASLGRLEVRISVMENQVSASIVTENESVRELIQSHQHLLRTALVEQGFAAADIRVDVAAPSQGGESRSSFDDHWNGDRKESSREKSSGDPGGWRDPPPKRRFAGGESDRRVSLFA